MSRWDPARCVVCGECVSWHGFHAEWFHDQDPKDRHLAIPPQSRAQGAFAAWEARKGHV